MEQDLLHQVPITLLLPQEVREAETVTLSIIYTILNLAEVLEHRLQVVIIAGQRAQEQLG
jgi:hypothetical protein